jgi:tRNA uridine 5-carboxymethylaminomethyl modification enzyme
METLEKGRIFVKENKINPNKETLEMLRNSSYPTIHQSYSFFDILKRTDWNEKMLSSYSKEFDSFPQEIKEELAIESKYEGYIVREKSEIKKIQKYRNFEFPKNFNFSDFPMLSKDSLISIEENKPKTIADAQKLPGVKPSDIVILISMLKKLKLLS